MSRRTSLVAVLLCLAAAATGCLGIPEDGPIVETQTEVDPNEELGYYNDPRPPSPGQPPAEVVKGFLDAMTAIPMQTNTAEEYLTEEAAASWRPQQATITYADASLPEGSNTVSVELSGANQIDGSGAWRGPLPPDERELTFPMQREEGEWRIARAPDARVVPESWFGQAFRRVSLHYFDPSARIMVPEPVFLPRGDQLPTALVSRLLQGPPARFSDVAISFLPPGADVEPVTVSEAGVADVRFTGGGAMPAERDASLMVAQLASTLSQDSAVTGMRVSIDGEPVILSEGSPVFPMDRHPGRFYDPVDIQSTSMLFALRDGRLVAGTAGGLTQATGPMGTSDLGIDQVSVNLAGERVAGVTPGGGRVLLTDVQDPDAQVTQVVSRGTSLLAPGWDFAGRMWVVNRPTEGAELAVRQGSRLRPVTVPGISGEAVSRFLVSRDGSRLVAVLEGTPDSIVVSRVEYDDRGWVRGGTRAREIAWPDQPRISVLDIGWSSPTSLVVLHRLSGDLSQVRTLSVDGAPAGLTGISVTLQGRARDLASSPRSTDPLLVRTRSGVLDVLGVPDTPLPGSGDLSSVTYAG